MHEDKKRKHISSQTAASRGNNARAYLTIALTTVLGAAVLTAASFIQKSIAGFDLWSLKIYVVPLIFGSLSGFLIGVWRFRTQRAEQVLVEEQKRLRAIFDTVMAGIMLVDHETNQVIEFNRAAQTMLGYDREDVVGTQCVNHLCRPDGGACPLAGAGQAMDASERVLCTKDGRAVPVLKTARLEVIDGRKVIVEGFLDISQLKQAQAALRQVQIQQEAILNNIPDIAWLKDRRGRFVAVNEAFGKACGVAPKDVVGKTDLDVWPLALAQRYRADDDEVMQTGRSKRVEEPLADSRGHTAWIETIKTPIFSEKGNVVGTTGTARDITARKHFEQALRAEKERLAVTLRSIGDGVITTDRQGRITLINYMAEELTGWTEARALGQPLPEVFTIVEEMTQQPCEDPVKRIIDGGGITDRSEDVLLISRKGRQCTIARSGAPIRDAQKRIIGAVLVFRDVTEVRRMKKEMMKIEKLESLGVLAGGIAHDFNNFLTGIIGNISLAKLDINPKDKVSSKLEEMEKAALRAKELTQQLLTFSKGGKPVRVPTPLVNLLKESSSFAVRGSNVRCAYRFQTERLFANVDEGQIAQVIHNLTLNAVQAMPDGGVIHLAADRIDLPAVNPFSLKTGEYVHVTIQDQGIGIGAEHLKKVFDPYFTTKQKGSGLGLAVVHSIIDQHNGRIMVDSQIGQGTTFSIYLPAGPAAEPEQLQVAHSIEADGGSILIMDDEKFIRELAAEMLIKMGYEVRMAQDGAEAVRLYQQGLTGGRPFDAVILDLTVPGGMGGKQALQELLKIDQGVRAIASSGYSNDPVMSSCRRYGFQAAVKKPYMMQEMAAALQSVITHAPREGV